MVGYATLKPYHIITTPLAPNSGTTSLRPGAMEDANGDGLSNAISCAFAVDPHVMKAPITPQLDAFGNLRFSHHRWINPLDIHYHYETSADLVRWNPAEALIIFRRRSSGSIEDVSLTWRPSPRAAFFRARTSFR